MPNAGEQLRADVLDNRARFILREPTLDAEVNRVLARTFAAWVASIRRALGKRTIGPSELAEVIRRASVLRDVGRITDAALASVRAFVSKRAAATFRTEVYRHAQTMEASAGTSFDGLNAAAVATAFHDAIPGIMGTVSFAGASRAAHRAMQKDVAEAIAEGWDLNRLVRKWDGGAGAGRIASDARILARTAAIAASAKAQLYAYGQDPDVVAVQWESTFDARTCIRCSTLHGRVFPKAHAPPLPAHYQCRCVWLPIFKDASLNADLDNAEPYSAPAPAQFLQNDRKFETWLDGQDESIQRDFFGSELKYEAWNDGKLDLADMIRDDGTTKNDREVADAVGDIGWVEGVLDRNRTTSLPPPRVAGGPVASGPAPQTPEPVRWVAPTAETPSEPGYVYHATNTERALQIAEDGKLKTFGPSYGTDQPEWPDGSKQKRSYFTRKAGAAWQFAPEEGKPVLLRTRETDAFKRESTGDIYTTKAVKASALEVLTDRGWEPLAGPLPGSVPVVTGPGPAARAEIEDLLAQVRAPREPTAADKERFAAANRVLFAPATQKSAEKLAAAQLEWISARQLAQSNARDASSIQGDMNSLAATLDKDGAELSEGVTEEIIFKIQDLTRELVIARGETPGAVRNQIMEKVLAVPKPIALPKPVISDALKGERFGEAAYRGAAAEFSRMVAEREVSKGKAHIWVQSAAEQQGTLAGRGSFDYYTWNLTMGAMNSTRTTVHELGHWLEAADYRAKELAGRFLDRRTAGEPIQKMADLAPGGGYQPDEIARPDKFINPYVGKVYGDRSTEILSMGIERMWDDPAGFAKADPEHFDFTLAIMRGDYSAAERIARGLAG